MKVCILGNGLVSFSLANVLIQKNLQVDILFNKKNIEYDKTRTLGISKSNLDYFNKEIANIEKISWKINNIKIFTENYNDQEIINFSNKRKEVFAIINNYKLYELLKKKLQKSKIVKFKNSSEYKKIIKENYKLIINCDFEHEITNNFFFNRIEKNYHSKAYTTIITHKKFLKNDIAYQNFTNVGPIAFLPVSNFETSVVYSLRDNSKKNKSDIKNLIRKFNPKYSIIKIDDCKEFNLKSSTLRRYYKENILAFGDLLHKIHPLAGQGFNMSLRDIKILSKLIDERMNVGLDLDTSICSDFQKSIQDKNFIFSAGIDWIYEIFNFESKTNSQLISKSIKMIGKNRSINSLFKRFADNGIRF